MLQAALSAAERAEAAAQGSSEHASRALGAAQATARALLTSKRAECEAAEILEKTKNPKDADPVAADLLRVCLIASLGHLLASACCQHIAVMTQCALWQSAQLCLAMNPYALTTMHFACAFSANLLTQTFPCFCTP